VTYYGSTAIAGTAIASDAASIISYGTLDRTLNTLLATSADALDLADWQVGIYAEPRFRVDKITVDLDMLSTIDQQTTLGLELGDVVTVKWTPNNVGDPLEQVVSIDAIEFTATPSPSRSISFTLSQTTAAFILDDLSFGKLDSNVLGF